MPPKNNDQINQNNYDLFTNTGWQLKDNCSIDPEVCSLALYPFWEILKAEARNVLE